MGRLKQLRSRILIGVVLAALGLWLWRHVQTQDEVAPDTLLGNGTVEATEVDISAKVAGKVLSLSLAEGDSVRANQVIAVLDSEELAAQVEQAEASLRAAEATLAELRAGTRSEEIRRAHAQHQAAVQAWQQAKAHLDLVRAGPRPEQIEQVRAAVRQAEVALNDAQIELHRAATLEAQGAVAAQKVDQARTRRDSAAAALDAARQRLIEAEKGARSEELAAATAAVRQAGGQVGAARAALDLALAGPRPETIAAARARVEQARAAVRAAQAQHGYTDVRAPVDGTVTLRNVELGELVTPGLPIVRLAELGDVWLRVYVPETELGRVKLGQRADVTSDTYPNKRYQGRVVEIAQEPEFTPKNVQTREERVKLVFGVKIRVENPEHELKPGMPADAVIHVGAAR